MITLNNLKEYYSSIHAISNLPNELVFDFPFIEQSIEFYNDDDDIRACMDTYLLKINEFLKKNDYCLENGELVKSKGKQDITDNPNVHVVSVPKMETKKQVKPKATTKQKAEPKPKASVKQAKPKVAKSKTQQSKIQGKPIEKLPTDVYYIKRYIAMNGKVKTGDQVLNLLHSLQKAMTERTINKQSEYAKEIEQIQNELIKCVEAVNTSAVIDIDTKRYEHYRGIVEQYQAMLSVTYLKKYISLNGKSGVKGKAQELARLIRKAVDNNKIPKTDRYAKQLEAAYKNLIEFSDNTFVIEQTELNGLQGLDGGLGFITPLITGIAANVIAQQVNKSIENKGNVINSVELAGMEFETLNLTGDYKKLIGTPSKNFSAMVYGMPGSGKTTWCIKFAKYLAEYHNLNVLFATIEEGINHTAQEKLNRLRAAHRNLAIADHMPENLSAYDVVFLDSINSFRYSTEDLRALRNRYPNMIFICIFQATKEGKFKGSQEYEHDVDVVIKAENGTITTVSCKNRFGAGGEVRVW